MLSVSIANLSLMMSNSIGATVTVFIAIISTRCAMRCSGILPDINSSNIERYDFGVVGLQFGLRITTKEECFIALGKCRFSTKTV